MNRLNSKGERGAVLVIALIFLVILTLLGVVAANVTGLEERMAGNTRDRDLAFQAAEAALSAVQGSLTDTTFRGTATTLVPTNANDQAYWAAYNWSTAPHANASPVPTAQRVDIDDVAEQPRFVLERIGATNRYRVTARGVGGTATAIVILQAEYVYSP